MASITSVCTLGFHREQAADFKRAVDEGAFDDVRLWDNAGSAGQDPTLVFEMKKNRPFVLIIAAGLLFAGAWYFRTKGMKTGSLLLVMAALYAAMGIYKLIRNTIVKVHKQDR